MTGKRKITKIKELSEDGTFITSQNRVKPGKNYFTFSNDEKKRIFRVYGEKVYLTCKGEPDPDTGIIYFTIPVSIMQEVNENG